MTDEPYAVVHRTHDPLEVEIAVDLLENNGIPARAFGTRNAALIGAGQHIFEQRVEVPESRVAEAAELISAMLSGSRPVDEPPPAPSPRRALLAAGVVFVFPGAGHFYARRHAAGLVLALAQLAAIAAVVGDSTAAGTTFV